MTTVYWSPVSEPANSEFDKTPEFQIIFSEPESLFKHLQKTRKDSNYMRCPAFLDSIKNTYIIKSPVDMKIRIDREQKTLSIDTPSDRIRKFVIYRIDESGKNDPALLSLPPNYVFYSNENIQMESMPAFMDNNESNNITVIPGIFNISKWIRPIDLSVEIKNDKKVIDIKRDDVIMYLRFKAYDDSKVELERVPMTKELEDAIANCISVKFQMSNLPLKTLYKISESFISSLSFMKKKKCPFGFKK